MPKKRPTRILTLLPDEKNAAELEPFLSRSTMEISHASSATEALSLSSATRFSLAMARLPLPDKEIAEFIGGLQTAHQGDGPLPIILMGESSELAARGFGVNQDSSVVRPVALDEGEEPLRHAISESLGVAARLAVRIPVRLDVSIDSGRTIRYCETRNLSRSGMLVASPQELPVGTEFGFELILPYSYVSLRGFAHVARHASSEREGTVGFGAQFVELTKIDTVRIESFIRSKLARPPFGLRPADDPVRFPL